MKKYIYIIVALLLMTNTQSFAQWMNEGDSLGTAVTAPIRPNAVADNIPTAYTNEIRGGIHNLQTWAELQSIKSSLLVENMLATVADSAGKVFQYDGAGWIAFQLGISKDYADNNYLLKNNVASDNCVASPNYIYNTTAEIDESYTVDTVVISGDIRSRVSVGEGVFIVRTVPFNTSFNGIITSAELNSSGNTVIAHTAQIDASILASFALETYLTESVLRGSNIALGNMAIAKSGYAIALGDTVFANAAIAIGKNLTANSDDFSTINIGRDIFERLASIEDNVSIGADMLINGGINIGYDIDNNNSSKKKISIGWDLESNSVDEIGTSINIGSLNTSVEDKSITIGQGLDNRLDYGMVIGNYNSPYSDVNTNGVNSGSDSAYFIIGNGINDGLRNNNLVLSYNGNLKVSGKMSQLGYPVDTMDLVTKGYADNNYKSKQTIEIILANTYSPNFSTQDAVLLTISGNLTINLETGVPETFSDELIVYISSPNQSNTISFPALWKFIGAKPTTLAANEIGLLTLKSFTAEKIVAEYQILN